MNKDIRQDAIEYLNKTEFSPQQRKALNEAFISQINAFGRALEGTFTSGNKKGQSKDWLDYATKNRLLNDVQVTLTAMPTWYTSRQQEAINQAIAQAVKVKY